MTATPPDLLGEGAPVILIEGRRNLPEGMAARLQAVGSWLAEAYPRALFRSGNAEGSDTAFTEGVTAVDPARMQYVLPNPSIRARKSGPAGRLIEHSHKPLRIARNTHIIQARYATRFERRYNLIAQLDLALHAAPGLLLCG